MTEITNSKKNESLKFQAVRDLIVKPLHSIKEPIYHEISKVGKHKIDGLEKIKIIEFRSHNILNLLFVKLYFCDFCTFLRPHQNLFCLFLSFYRFVFS